MEPAPEAIPLALGPEARASIGVDREARHRYTVREKAGKGAQLN